MEPSAHSGDNPIPAPTAAGDHQGAWQLREMLVRNPTDGGLRRRYLALRTPELLEEDVNQARAGILQARWAAAIEGVWLVIRKTSAGAMLGGLLGLLPLLGVILIVSAGHWGGWLIGGLLVVGMGVHLVRGLIGALSGPFKNAPKVDAWEGFWTGVGMLAGMVVLVLLYLWRQAHLAQPEDAIAQENRTWWQAIFLVASTESFLGQMALTLFFCLICTLTGGVVGLVIGLCGGLVLVGGTLVRRLTLTNNQVREHAELGPLPTGDYALSIEDVRKKYAAAPRETSPLTAPPS